MYFKLTPYFHCIDVSWIFAKMEKQTSFSLTTLDKSIGMLQNINNIR